MTETLDQHRQTTVIIVRILLVLISVILSIGFVGLGIETVFRVRALGWQKGIQSYVQKSTPYSVLGAHDWVVSDAELGYRLNPVNPDVNTYSMKEKEVTVPKPAGTYRVIILGDSVPFTGNPTFVDLLKQRYAENPRIEILNASVPGYTAYQEMKFLETTLLPLEPDLVLYNYVVNDNFRFLHKFDSQTDMVLTDEAKEEYMIHSYWDMVVSKSYFLSSLKARSKKTYPESGYRKSIYPWDNDAAFSAAWKDFSWTDVDGWIKEMYFATMDKKGQFGIVIFPIQAQLDDALLVQNRDYVRKPQDRILSICASLRIGCLDLFDPFHKTNSEGLFSDGLHLTDRGHQVAAESISDFLSQYLQ